MSAIQFSNSASSLLAASIDDNDLVIQVTSTEGSLFPSPGVGQYFKLALVNAEGDLEICHCTSRTGDLLTVTRAQEGTVAQAWTNGATRCELRLTKETMENFVQKTGDSMSGDLDMAGNELQDARITGDTVMVAGQLVGTALRGTEDDSSNEIVVPNDGSRATAGGSPLVTQEDVASYFPVGSVIMWYGAIGTIPDGWQLCDGTNGTPDMRGAFPRGAGGAFTLGGSGGAATAAGNTGSAGAHDHGAATGAHALAESEIPSHTHNVRGAGGPGAVISRPNIADAGVYGLGGAAYSSGSPNPFYQQQTTGDSVDFLQATGGSGSHSHTITSEAAHAHDLSAVSILPTFKQLYFIMKVS